MSDVAEAMGRAELPGPDWDAPAQARAWLIDTRTRLGWVHKDAAKALFTCALTSDLHIGPGGGARFDPATEKRVARFAQGGEIIPEWMFWMPLVVQHAQVSSAMRWTWERENVPMHRELRRECEETDAFDRQFDLDDAEMDLIMRFRALGPADRRLLRDLAAPAVLRAIREELAETQSQVASENSLTSCADT